MIRHLLKMVWYRKRINGLIMIEIFFSFIVLFAVLTMGIFLATNYRHPLGFSIERVWSININTRLPWETHRKEKVDGMEHITTALRDLPEIESIGGVSMAPYSHSEWISNSEFNGREISTRGNEATDGLKSVLGIDLTAGRWFTPDDNGAAFKPAVINERLAQDLYGSENPLGKELPFNKERVVGVMRDFRKAGAFSQTVNYLITRINISDTADRHILYTILIKVKPGTTAAFQERLVKALESVQKNWTFEVAQLEHERDEDAKVRLAPLLAGGIIAMFLLSMVALGLIGVLWQNVSQRTTEIGLRRALGGTARHVSRQIHAEQFVITTIGVAAASALVLQVPLLNLAGDSINLDVYLSALFLSLFLMYGLTYFCSMFPGWLAMEIEPAEALHYE